MTLPIDIPTELISGLHTATSISAAEAALVQTLEGGRAALPVLPTIASQALELANDPDSSVHQFAQLVKTDPPIAARFLATANSSFYSRGNIIDSVEDAVARVGISGSRDLVFQVVYAANSAGLRRYQTQVQESFQRSVLCGVLCRIGAPALGLQMPDAYLCGLLHDIGEARVYRILSELGPTCSDEEAADLVVKYHPRAGSELAIRWALPDDIVQVCRRHHDSDDAYSPQVRLVRIADILVPLVQAAVGPASQRGQPELPDGLEQLGLTASEAQRLIDRGTAAASRL